jgi:hypothetical protein
MQTLKLSFRLHLEAKYRSQISNNYLDTLDISQTIINSTVYGRQKTEDIVAGQRKYQRNLFELEEE